MWFTSNLPSLAAWFCNRRGLTIPSPQQVVPSREGNRPRAHTCTIRQPPRGESTHKKKFDTGRLRPGVQPHYPFIDLFFFSEKAPPKSLPFYVPEAWKRYPFQAEPPRIGNYREFTPRISHVLVCRRTHYTPKSVPWKLQAKTCKLTFKLRKGACSWTWAAVLELTFCGFLALAAPCWLLLSLILLRYRKWNCQQSCLQCKCY